MKTDSPRAASRPASFPTTTSAAAPLKEGCTDAVTQISPKRYSNLFAGDFMGNVREHPHVLPATGSTA